MKMKNKKAQIISGLVGGIAGLIILVIVSLLIVSTLNGAGLLSAGGTLSAANVSTRMIANYTTGIDNISEKLPTILLIAAVVLLFGAIVFLVQRSKSITSMGGGV